MKGIQTNCNELEMIATKQRWNEEDARFVLNEHRESEQSLASFCRQNGLSYQRVILWRKKLQQQMRLEQSETKIVPLHIVTTDTPEEPGKRDFGDSGQWAIEVEFAGRCIRANELASESLLTRALQAVRRVAC